MTVDTFENCSLEQSIFAAFFTKLLGADDALMS